MRTLLIDNHDSFTYNLYQYLAACNDEPPFVVQNDSAPWSDVEKLDFDNIVISPGPGRPQRPADLGLSSDALRQSRVPVLGVCLGHQAIAHHCGARVGLAARPMHGRLDRISHLAEDIFRGIPTGFEAVRYHSLAVTDLPSELEPLAWTADGTIMGLRHVSRPWWGVQFHPESICTEYGARLLRNFHDLTLAWGQRHHRSNSMGSFLPEFRVGQAAPLSVHARLVDVFPDAAEVFSAIFADSPACFWLDSSLNSGSARFSFMGNASGPNAKLITYRSETRMLDIHTRGIVESRSQSIFDYLREQVPTPRNPSIDLPFDFTGGFVGYCGYELKADLEGSRTHVAASPDAAWIYADRFLAFDHAEKQVWVVCLDALSLSASSSAWMDTVAARLSGPLPSAPQSVACAPVGTFQWSTALPDYRDLILRAQHEIVEGETYEVCLTNQLVANGSIDALGVYLALRQRSPAPYAAFFKIPEVTVLCASPELFLRIGCDGLVETKPIKGTSRRGTHPSEDLRLKESLATDEKTRAENLMIVDLLRNDLNRVCEVGSVHVPGLFEIESFSTVHQMVSTIRGKLRSGLSIVDCLRATFPGGSMTGAPKERTMKILDALEGSARGVYSGCLGYLSNDGTAQLNIVIRTIVSAGDRVSIGAGGAIIALSDPDDEVAEVVLKAHAPWEVLQQCGAEPGSMPGVKDLNLSFCGSSSTSASPVQPAASPDGSMGSPGA